MKGISFQKPLEFTLRVEGESWQQGDQLSGTLTVKNHDTNSVQLNSLQLQLSYGELKKVRLKDPHAFKPVTSIPLSAPPTLEGQKEISFPWAIPTDRNCPITDNLASLFLLYGAVDSIDKLAQLQLLFHPYQVIQDFLNILSVDFRFVIKSKKSTKGFVEVKLAPPDAKGFATLEQLVIRFRFEGDTLDLHYVFHVKKVEASAASIDVKKDKKDFQQSLLLNQYRTTSGRFNHTEVEAAIREVISQAQ